MEKLELTSSAFENQGDIPDLYTCRGKNISPPLSFRSAPAGTKSCALFMVDLDTPIGTITHWVVGDGKICRGSLSQKTGNLLVLEWKRELIYFRGTR